MPISPIALIIALAVSQTPNTPAAEGPRCIPGAQLACACLGGTTGIQVCNPDGASLGACECPAVSQATPSSQSNQVAHASKSIDLGPRSIPYREGATIPLGYDLEVKPNYDLITTGLGIAGSTYLLSGLIASMIDAGGTRETSHRWLYLPVLGPVISAANPERGQKDTHTFVLILDGLIQTTGAVLAIYGATVEEKSWVRSDLAVAPMAIEDGFGLSFAGAY